MAKTKKRDTETG